MSYDDSRDMTPLERLHILGFITEEIDKQNKIIEELNRLIASKRNNRSY